MSGRHRELVNAGTASLPRGPRRDCLRRLLEFLLDKQCVKSFALQTDCGKLRRAVEWAWPILKICVMWHSIALPNLGAPTLWFFVSMESGCMFGFVMTYSLLALFGDRPSVRQLCAGDSAQGEFFRITAECTSTEEVQFWDLKKCKSGSRCHTMPCTSLVVVGLKVHRHQLKHFVADQHPAQHNA